MFPTTDGHQWISLTDSIGESWMFDLTFLASGFDCIYGKGCRSISESDGASGTLGCCIHGAHLADDDDLTETRTYVDRLTADQWQFATQAAKKGSTFKRSKDGTFKTRRHRKACIFLNREGFEGGAGCALHIAAEAAGERPMDWKPDVCWQVPIRLEVFTDDNEHDTMLIKAWDRRDWGEGGIEFGWWCIEDDGAYAHSRPLYRAMEDELRELVGDEVYDAFASRADKVLAEGHVTPVSLG